MQGEGMQQTCWACGTAVHVPVFSGQPVPLFKCGWCKALNTHDSTLTSPASTHPTPPPDGQQQQQQRLQVAAPSRPAPPLAARMVGGVVCAIVLTLISSIAVAGMAVLLPGVAGPWALMMLLYPWTGFLVLNILYSYAACVLRHPGPAQLVVQGAVASGNGLVPQDAFNDFQFCGRCRYYKPPTAHHCRNCGTCVVGLDHHCWYLGNNCVGAGNLRQFLQFLVWLLAGVGYALAAAAVMGWRVRQQLWKHTWRTWQASAGFRMTWRLVSYSLRWTLSAPLWMALWGFSLGLCTITLLMVGLLLHRQVVLLLRGQSYLDALQYQQRHGSAAAAAGDGTAGVLQGSAASTVAGGVGNAAAGAAGAGEGAAVRLPVGISQAWWESRGARCARGVFGDGHPLTWLFPMPRKTAPGPGSKKQS